MVGFAQMVILLSFLSSTEQQQNNVITVAVLAKVLTSFHSEKVVETTVFCTDSYQGLVCLHLVLHTILIQKDCNDYLLVILLLRNSQIWGQN